MVARQTAASLLPGYFIKVQGLRFPPEYVVQLGLNEARDLGSFVAFAVEVPQATQQVLVCPCASATFDEA